MKYTTLNEIKKAGPCGQKKGSGEGWDLLLTNLGKLKADDEKLSFQHILDSNGLNDAVWALRVLPYKEVCLFTADVAELVLPIFEKRYPDDSRPRDCINAIRQFYRGEISEEELSKFRDAARATAYAADADAARAAYAADADAADAATAYAADADAARADVRSLFIKNFC